MLLFVGLGNPGARYAANRHNIGFMVVEAIAKAYGASPWRRRYQADAAEAVIGDARVLLLKPQTFMNESGRAVGEAMRFHKIALENIVVFHDELDLAPAKVRAKSGGGNAGHNGLRSITALCGNAYRRVRLGIGHPGDKTMVHPHVLGDFTSLEMIWVNAVCRACSDHAPRLTGGEDERFMSDVAAALGKD